METKETVRALLDRLPDDCTIEEVLYHLYVIEQVGRGLEQADRGELVPHEDVEEEFRRRWLLGDG